jgi:hypothetical protein
MAQGLFNFYLLGGGPGGLPGLPPFLPRLFLARWLAGALPLSTEMVLAVAALAASALGIDTKPIATMVPIKKPAVTIFGIVIRGFDPQIELTSPSKCKFQSQVKEL